VKTFGFWRRLPGCHGAIGKSTNHRLRKLIDCERQCDAPGGASFGGIGSRQLMLGCALVHDASLLFLMNRVRARSGPSKPRLELLDDLSAAGRPYCDDDALQDEAERVVRKWFESGPTAGQRIAALS